MPSFLPQATLVIPNRVYRRQDHLYIMKVNIKKILLTLLICITLSILSVCVYAQKPTIPKPSSNEEARPVKQEVTLDDPLGRSTPQGTVLGFMKAADKEDYTLVAKTGHIVSKALPDSRNCRLLQAMLFEARGLSWF